MIRILSFDAVAPQDILNRDIRAEADVEAVVDGIIADVRARGDAALRDYARKFDHAELDSLLVTQAEIDEKIAEQAASVGKETEEYKKTMDPRQLEYIEGDIKVTKLFDYLQANNEMVTAKPEEK